MWCNNRRQLVQVMGRCQSGQCRWLGRVESRCPFIADGTFSERIWQFRNKVVHGQLEEFKESKIVHNLRHRVQELYSQFQKDPFMLPQSRSHLFNKPIQVISSMDRDGMTCWIKSIEEALLTREHRDRLEAVHLKSTLFRFFQLTRRSSNPKAAKRYVPSLWAAPFSSKHYQQTNHTRRKPRALRHSYSHLHRSKTKLPNKSKPKSRNKQHIKTLMEFGFQQVPATSPGLWDRKKIEKMDYSGTLLSTAPWLFN